jgi:hypothetical protein
MLAFVITIDVAVGRPTCGRFSFPDEIFFLLTDPAGEQLAGRSQLTRGRDRAPAMTPMDGPG